MTARKNGPGSCPETGWRPRRNWPAPCTSTGTFASIMAARPRCPSHVEPAVQPRNRSFAGATQRGRVHLSRHQAATRVLDRRRSRNPELGSTTESHRSGGLSLWGVPDKETHELMREFYHRVWSERPVPRAEALRQAQLWMLENWKPLRGGVERPAPQGSPLPYVWAAFVLSGDWR